MTPSYSSTLAVVQLPPLDAVDAASSRANPKAATEGLAARAPLALVPDAPASIVVTQAVRTAWSSAQTSSADVPPPIVDDPATVHPALVPRAASTASSATANVRPTKPVPVKKRAPTEAEVIDQFTSFLQDHGMLVPASIVGGAWTRILKAGAGEPASLHDSPFTYILNLQQKRPSGVLKSFSGDKHLFRAARVEAPAGLPSPRRAWTTIAATREATSEDFQAAHCRALQQWEEASAVSEEHLHPYLLAKRIKRPHGLRVNTAGELLVLQTRVADDVATGCQRIFSASEKWEKRYPPRMGVTGLTDGVAYQMGGVDPATPIIAIAEGVATAATVREATGWCVFVAFDSGNLPKVADAVRRRWPDATIVIAADNDCFKLQTRTERGAKHGLSNAGIVAGQKAAQVARAHLAIAPVDVVPGADAHGWSDWNDVSGAWSLETIRARLTAVLETPAGGGSDTLERFGTVVLEEGKSSAATTEILRILDVVNARDPNGGFFTVGTEMVHIVDGEDGPIVCPVSFDWMAHVLATYIRFLGVDGRSRSKELRDVEPDPRLTRRIINIVGKLDVKYRPLRGVIDTPTIRADGSILDTPGYDPASTLFVLPRVKTFPAVRPFPTAEEQAAAFATLLFPFREYRFSSPAGMSALLATLLSVIARRAAIPMSPMTNIDAPGQSYGKTLLATEAIHACTGHPPFVLPYNPNKVEMDKQLGAAALAGAPAIVIDNVVGTFDSSFLSGMATTASARVRKFNTQEFQKAKIGTVISTSNNGTMSTDLGTRYLTIRIAPSEEAPEERQFETDIHAHVGAHWPQMLVAGLTILRAHALRGFPRPMGMKPHGKFSAWDKVVRSAIINAGYADPIETQKTALRQSPDRIRLENFINSAVTCLGAATWTIRELTEKVLTVSAADASANWRREMPVEDHEALVVAVADIAAEQDGINARKLGTWLADNLDKGVKTHRIEKAGVKRNYQVWRIT